MIILYEMKFNPLEIRLNTKLGKWDDLFHELRATSRQSDFSLLDIYL